MSKVISTLELIKNVAAGNGIMLTEKEANKVNKLVETTLPTYTDGESMEIIITDAVWVVCKVEQHEMVEEF